MFHLEAIRDKNHDEHEEMLQWLGGSFDPEAFDATVATKAIRKELPDLLEMG
jgi:hypothetical protein